MDITSLLLGPKSENYEAFRAFFDIIIEDVLNFRNNYHPDELPIISERHKLEDSFLKTSSDFRQGLKEVLSKLRAHSIPTWDTSYIAHMHGDLLYPAIAGYISTIMYNPNNVTGESSPVTTQWEMDFIHDLCRMIGYPEFSAAEPKSISEKGYSWGHITSGGTVANIEGLWVARNLKYWPICLKLAIDHEREKYSFLENFEFKYYDNSIIKFGSLSYLQLFNLSPDLVYKISLGLAESFTEKNPGGESLSKSVKKYSLQYLGLHGIHAKVKERTKLDLPYPIVLISQTKHYSWEKCLEVLGLGIEQLVKMPADIKYQLDLEYLKNTIANPNIPVLAVIPIIGTTEEGIIDPLHLLIKLRTDLEKSHGISFYIHADAAYGGYFASIFSSHDFSKHKAPDHSLNEFKDCLKVNKTGEYITEEGFYLSNEDLLILKNAINQIYNDITNLSLADSITIDPHKLGYVPYPAGSILFKNYKAKELITFEAPYLEWSGDKLSGVDRIFLGQTTLEGSRPGASAAACFLATKIVPLNISGYGKIMLYNILAAQKFFKSIPPYESHKCKIIPQYLPTTNIICYCLSYPGVIEEPKYLNFLTNKVFENMTKKLSKRTTAYDYFISKTKINYEPYKEHINTLLREAVIPEEHFELMKATDNGDFNILRSVFMNPLALGLPENYYSGFWDKVEIIVEAALEDVLDDLIKSKFNNKRVKVLWIENRDSVEKLKNEIETSVLGRYFSFSFIWEKEALDQFNKLAKEENANISGDANIVISDLCLDGHHSENIDINKVFPILNSCYLEGKQIICYSRYLSQERPSAKNIEHGILNEFKKRYNLQKNSQIHFVGKETNFEEFEKNNFKNFESSDKVHSDMDLLIKKMILTLQRIKK